MKNSKKIISQKVLAALLMVMTALAFMPVQVLAADNESVGSVTIKAGACGFAAADQIDLIKQQMTVAGDTAENYGYTDNGDTSKVTALDAFVTMHIAKYADAYTKDNATEYLVCASGWLSKAFGIETYSIGYYLNKSMTSTTASETFLSDGDEIDMFKYQDTEYYSDMFSYFTEEEKTVTSGETFTLQIEGGYPWGSDAYAPLTNNSGGTVQAGITGTDGDKYGVITPVDGATPDENGNITLKFDEPGIYYVSAKGKSYASGLEMLCPIVQPVCEVKVMAKPTGTKITKLKKAKKAFTVKWKKNTSKISSSHITGYQIRYSTDKSMKSNIKTKTVKCYKKTSKKIKNLKKKTKYYVQVRTYVKGKDTTVRYSDWSKIKSVKTK